MKTYQEGSWMVMTPIYAGSEGQVRGMAACDHDWADTPTQPAEKVDGHAVHLQRCRCGAVRSRWRVEE